jgi:hypothetical protein
VQALDILNGTSESAPCEDGGARESSDAPAAGGGGSACSQADLRIKVALAALEVYQDSVEV